MHDFHALLVGDLRRARSVSFWTARELGHIKTYRNWHSKHIARDPSVCRRVVRWKRNVGELHRYVLSLLEIHEKSNVHMLHVEVTLARIRHISSASAEQQRNGCKFVRKDTEDTLHRRFARYVIYPTLVAVHSPFIAHLVSSAQPRYLVNTKRALAIIQHIDRAATRTWRSCCDLAC